MFKRSFFIFMGMLYLVFILTTPLLFFGKDLEARFFPVVGDARLQRVESDGPGSVRIWIAFKKYRDCTFVDLSWYQVDAVTGGQERLRLEFLEDEGNAPVSRPEGFQLAGPWKISISPYAFGGEVVAFSRHRCHPLWDTLSKFY